MSATSGVQRPEVILFADADPEAARIISPFLARHGDVRRVSTLREAREQWLALKPALVVVDPNLPDGDGIALVEELRETEPWEQVFVICAANRAASTSLFIAAGANDVAVKPFDVGSLATRVARLLRAGAQARVQQRERLELEQKLRHADRIGVLGTLCATVAHEVANPLLSIQLNADALRESVETTKGVADSGDVLELAAEIRRAGDVIGTIIGRVRSFSRKREEPRHEARLGEVVDTTLLLLKPRILAKRAVVTLPESRGPIVSHYPTALAQALLNTVLNALEAQRDGAMLTINYVAREGAVGIEVTDSGPGLPRELLDATAATFFTTKPEGTGLGLLMIRGVMNEHGGRFELTPRGDGRSGACATLLLPVDPDAPLLPASVRNSGARIEAHHDACAIVAGGDGADSK